jgi:hypothetical protein
MFKVLANLFRGIHRAIGITDLPSDATPTQEKRFVLMWLSILLAVIVWIALIFFFLFRVL